MAQNSPSVFQSDVHFNFDADQGEGTFPAVLTTSHRQQRDHEHDAFHQTPTRPNGRNLPDPFLGLQVEDYVSFTQHLNASTRIAALLGAGLSAASGIPTFRGAGALWRGIPPKELSSPYAFRDNPVLVWQYHNFRRHIALHALPNTAHYALAHLGEYKDFMAITQNIDGLSQRAGHQTAHLQPIHGTLFDIKCSNPECNYLERENIVDPIIPEMADYGGVDLSDPNVSLPSVTIEQLPHCPKCNSLLRPAVVWFSEVLPGEVLNQVDDWMLSGNVDLMLVIGTHASVWPAADYVEFAREQGARIAHINTEDPSDDQKTEGRDWFFKGDAAVIVPELLKGVIGAPYCIGL
ncbi:DHS-like NAD/FAD-binding domain-containing protein [Tothia fuscella]|uniref:DHS-like NAD/FAD-binding domain-containing protein n=1 Tax=Tothia fuscella TaxID=1048955 RepID=A0A9P4P070_9PEZI|nr:DHS-like NAD/FAD-binding domain-containing protein [Tothia fuscella]